MLTIRIPLIAVLTLFSVIRLSAVAVSQFNVALTEDFDTLATATGSVLPAGWEFSEAGSSANTTYGAGTGSSSTGNTYSFGATSATERALGSVRTSGVAATFGTVVTNNTAGTIGDLTIAYTGEQWRLGALGRIDQLDFSYSFDATSLTTGNWLDADALDFIGPVTAGVAGALDGNDPANQQLLSVSITGLNLANGSSLWLRWVDFDASGSDDGLAIDNFSIVALENINGGGGGGGGGEAVPDHLPTSMIVAVMGGLLALASNRRMQLA